MALSLFRTKPIEQPDSGLHKCLSAVDLTLLGIGAIIGAGIFVLTGHAAAHQSGPAVSLSYVVAGLACTFAALAYAELASSVGGCGSAYGYSYAAFGEVIAWLIGWLLLLEYAMSVAAVANGWSGYFLTGLSYVGIVIPKQFTAAPQVGGLINLPAAAIILVLMFLLIVGIKQSARLNAAMVFIKLLTLAFFIGIAAFHVNPEHWHPFMPYGWFNYNDGNPVGVLAGASIVFFAYVGFDAVSTAVEEARNPQRDVPIGIVGSLAFCTLIYIVVSTLLTGVAPYGELSVDYPVAHALEIIGFGWASALVSAGAIAGLTTVMLVLYYALTRIIFAMSRDGLLPDYFNHVNAVTRTPVRVIVPTGIGMALVAGLFPLGELAEMVNIGTLAAFVMVCLGVIVMRIRHPDLPRPFKSPFSPLFPMIGMLMCAALMLFLKAFTWKMFAAWISLGTIVYFTYSIRHSKLAQ